MPVDQILSNLVGTLFGFFRIEGGLEGKEYASPDTPGSGDSIIYPKSDGDWYKKDDEGTESLLGGSGSAVNVPIGTIIMSYTGAITGAATLSQIRAAGFATCDGTTASSQGISDPTITSAMPNLDSSQRFFCGHDSTAGSTGDDQLQTHTHTVPNLDTVHYVSSSGSVATTDATQSATSGGVSGANSGSETRPINVSVVCCMRVK